LRKQILAGGHGNAVPRGALGSRIKPIAMLRPVVHGLLPRGRETPSPP
jgi:hypothetical protein